MLKQWKIFFKSILHLPTPIVTDKITAKWKIKIAFDICFKQFIVNKKRFLKYYKNLMKWSWLNNIQKLNALILNNVIKKNVAENKQKIRKIISLIIYSANVKDIFSQNYTTNWFWFRYDNFYMILFRVYLCGFFFPVKHFFSHILMKTYFFEKKNWRYSS